MIVQAGSSGPGRELAAGTAEIIFTAAETLHEGQAFYADVKQRMAKYGREFSHVAVMPGLFPVIRRTKAEAQEKYDFLQSLVEPEVGLFLLQHLLSRDLSMYPLDEPLPDLADHNGAKGRTEVILRTPTFGGSRTASPTPPTPLIGGSGGSFPVTDIDWSHALCEASIAGAAGLGYPRNPDYNGATQEGVGYYQRVIHRTRRISTARAYLHPVMGGPTCASSPRPRPPPSCWTGVGPRGCSIGERAIQPCGTWRRPSR